MLTFEEDVHRYFWKGQRVPSVTQVLSGLTDYSMIDSAALLHAQEEGKAIHKMVELDIKGDLDIGTLPEWLHPRYAAWLKFCGEADFVPMASERQLYHSTYRYAGTFDIAGVVCGRPSIIDVKRSLYAGDVIGLQTSAYQELWNSQAKKEDRCNRRYALVLLDEGNYRLPEYHDKTDFQTFIAALTMHRWRHAHQRTIQ